MDTITAAFATDDGTHFISRHFGDAKYFDIYVIDKDNAELIKRLDNTTAGDEEIHGDTGKAGSVSGLLLKNSVTVAVSKIFGPNIKRIKRKFVCILMNDPTIAESITRIQSNLDALISEWEKGTDRNYLNFLKRGEVGERI